MTVFFSVVGKSVLTPPPPPPPPNGNLFQSVTNICCMALYFQTCDLVIVMLIKSKIKIPNKYFIERIQNPLTFPPPPNPKLSKNIEYTLVKKSRTSAKIPRLIPYFFKFRKRHNKLPRFRSPVRVLVCDVKVLVCAVKVSVCAVKVFVCAVRVFVCAVSILLVLWAI